jgi:nucleoside-diphosphate-sugar epimerase
MQLVLTGAKGFTGRYVEQEARRQGHSVVELDSDLTDQAGTRDAVVRAAPSHVLHLGAISAVTHEDELSLYRVNLFGTMNLLKAIDALAVRPERVILASSANVYGNSGTSPIREDTPPAPVNHYAMSKLAMEMMSRASFGDRLPLLWTRPFNYTGVGHDQRFVIPKLVHHFATRQARVELGNLDVEREFNDVRPVAEAYVRLLATGAIGETYNICSGRPVSLRNVIASLQRLSGHALEVAVNPDFVRPNEVFRLTGSPDKLYQSIGLIEHRDLDDTLSWMLQAAMPAQ